MLVLILSVSAIIGLVLYALRQNINLFFTPSDLPLAKLSTQAKVRVGGMVLQDSVEHSDNLNVTFQITDYKANLLIKYRGLLPDLFREGQGVVVFGNLTNEGVFKAEQILAKHDQNYMPPGLSEKLAEVQDVT